MPTELHGDSDTACKSKFFPEMRWIPFNTTDSV